MRKMRRAIAFAALLTVAGGVALSGTATAQDAGDERLTFVIGTTGGLPHNNPFKALTGQSYYALALQYDLLFNFAQDDLSVAPGLATEWESSEDGLTWTITIRDGVTWHDGEPFTADDVAFTYNTIIENEVGAFISYFPNVDTIEAVDENTLVWKATQPTIAPELPPWVYILPKHIWEPVGDYDDMTQFANYPNPIGTGPFQMDEFVRGEHWSFTKNEDYWRGAPIIDEIVVRKYNNEEAMLSALKQGEIDYTSGLSVNLFNSLEGEEGISTHVGPMVEFTQLSFNMCDPATTVAKYCERNPGTAHPALRDPIVRQAIAKVIDREELVQRVLGGYGAPGTTIVPPFASQWHLDPDPGVQAYDPEGAAQMLDDAGYVDTDNDGVRETPDGEPLRFRLFLQSEFEEYQDSGEFIASWLEEHLQIQSDITVGAQDELIDLWYEHDFDMYVWGWGPDPDPDFIVSTFASFQCGVWGDTCYSNPEYDALYEQQQVGTDLADRQAVIDQMQQIIYDDVPEVVLYYYNDLAAYRSDRWTGFELSPQPEGFLWYQYTPYSELTVRPVGSTGGGGGTPAGDTGIPAGVWIGVVGGVIALIVIVALVRRGRSDEHLA